MYSGARGTESPIPQHAPPTRTRFGARCAAISFDTSSFELKKWGGHRADCTDVASFESSDAEIPLGFKVHFQHSPQYSPSEHFSVVPGEIGDDRIVYRQHRKYAEWWMRQMRRVTSGIGLEEQGLHLIWLGGRTSLGLTHRMPGLRMRKYSVILADSHLRRPTEVILTFAAECEQEGFWRLTPLIDRVVESIRTHAAPVATTNSGGLTAPAERASGRGGRLALLIALWLLSIVLHIAVLRGCL